MSGKATECVPDVCKKGKTVARKLGQIIARGDGRWLVRISLGRDPEKRRRRYHNRTIWSSLRSAQRYLNSRLEERQQAREFPGADLTLSQYLDRWLALAARPRLRAKSYLDYLALAARYIRLTLGEHMIRTLAPLDFQAVYQGMLEDDLSSRTIHYTHAVVHAALEQAVQWRLLPSNPSTGVALPKASRPEIRVLTPDEARRFLRVALATKYGPLLALALTTGLRPSEYLALRWSDIDWQEESVTVSRTLEKGTGWLFAETKRARSRRVKLQTWVATLLHRRHVIERGEGSTDSRSPSQIFRNSSGRPINSDYLARQFKRLLADAGLPPMRLYDLRHTAATFALAGGVSFKVVSEQLGHASSAFTLDVYSHLLPHMQTEAAGRVERLLGLNASGQTILATGSGTHCNQS